MTHRTMQVKEKGQSFWMDHIQRHELHDGTLKRLIEEDGLCGVTSNPTIFMNAVSKSRDYDEQIKRLVQEGKSSEEIYHHITVDDIRQAGTLFLPVFEQTNGYDGFVSIELNPQNAFNIEASIAEAQQIISEIGLPNIMVKVPGTPQGVSIVRQLIREGINVNITLLFSPDRYKQIAQTYIEALEERSHSGRDISDVHSVASFFISRIDTKVDNHLDSIAASQEALTQKISSLRGQAATAIAKRTYTLFKELFFADRFKQLQDKGARFQRVLWASTSTKDPSYSDVKYVDGLIAPHTVNTLPPKTLDAFRDHGSLQHTIEEGIQEAPVMLKEMEQCGIDFAQTYDELQEEGVKAFEKSYLDLLVSIEEKGRALRA